MKQVTLTETLRETLAVFDAPGEPKTTPEVATALDLGRRTAYHRLERLVEQEHLETKKVGANARVWWQPTAGDASEAELESLVEAVDEYAIVTLDDRWRITHVNDRAAAAVASSTGELVGERLWDAMPETAAGEVHDRLTEAMATQERTAATLRREGVDRWFEIRGFPSETGMSLYLRDITEQTEREAELRKRIRQQDVVAELGKQALEDHDLDCLFSAAVESVAETLDNEYCKILDLDEASAELSLREGVGWRDGLVGEITVPAVEDGSQAAHTLRSEAPVVVEDLTEEARFTGPDLLRSHGVKGGISTVIGPVDDPWGVLGTHDTEAASFSDHDVTFVQSVANILASAIDRHEREQRQRRQREQIAALNDLHEAVGGITSAVIEQSSREEIERTVCEHLAERESYQFAWIGEVDSMSQEVSLRTEAGVEGYLDDVTISVDPDDERSHGPTGKAFRTERVHTTRDTQADYPLYYWQDTAREYGFHSTAAIPIVHGGTTYGVLNVYSARTEAFEGNERAVIGHLGTIIGHAIAAVERKQALVSDEVVELEFQIQDIFDSMDIDTEAADPIRLEHTVMLDDEEFVFFGRTTAENRETVERMVEELPFYEAVSFSGDGDEIGFRLRVSEEPLLSVVTSVGGSIEEAEIRDGDYRFRVHLSPTADIRTVTDAIQSTYPEVTLLKRRQLAKQREGPNHDPTAMTDALTDCQQGALEAAYYAGFFEWPREASGEDIAASLDIAPPTFHQHLRKAEEKIFGNIV